MGAVGDYIPPMMSQQPTQEMVILSASTQIKQSEHSVILSSTLLEHHVGLA